MTTTQETASRVLKDNQVFTLRNDDGVGAGMRWWIPSVFRVFAKNMLTMDEPDHSRLRGIVDEAFHRRAVLDMAPRIRMNTNDAIETAHAFPDATIVPIHCDGWGHFTQSAEDLEDSFKALGIASRLRLLAPGVPTAIAPSRVGLK